jgi:hypothetical protein
MHTSRWPLAFLSALIAAAFLFIVFLLPCDGAQAHAQAPPSQETGAFSVPASRVQQPVRNAHASLALLAGSDSYVDAWVAYDIEFGSYNQGQCGTMQPHPDRIVGGNSNTWAILGCSTYGSWLVVDMGPDAEAIIDGPGNDFYVKEHNNNELYKVYVSNSPFGPWTPFGARKGNEYFNLADIGVSSARFLMLVAADCWYACPGADIQYIQALHMGDPLTGTLAGDETRAPECPVGNTSDASPGGGQPINLHSGNYHYQLPSFAVTSVGTPLLWDVSYNSHATDEYSYTLGYGWTHSYAMELVFPGDPGGEAGTVILHSARGPRFAYAVL